MRRLTALNPEEDGTSRTVKAQYYKNSMANFIRGGGYGATGVVEIDDEEDEEDSPERG